MDQIYKLAIIGSGPAGLSAACRAAARDSQEGSSSPSYILIEAQSRPSNTIYLFQKGKQVMAEPSYLKLRSDLPFSPGKREKVLDDWSESIAARQINIRLDATVTCIEGSAGAFQLCLADGSAIHAQQVLLAIGLQGNPRQLEVPGAERIEVQYQLDDPEACKGENIIIAGAGDAAVENALALAEHNWVTLLNRRDEFTRIKEGNRTLLLQAARDPNITLECRYSTTIATIKSGGEQPLEVKLLTQEGEFTITAHRVIARLGAVPPRAFLEQCGIEFPDSSENTLPMLSDHYESNVPGIFIVGSLAGYPLIKQAMNQGYDVVEHIFGNTLHSVDRELLKFQFAGLPYMLSVEDQVELMMTRVPMFRQLNKLAFRELVIESNIYACYADRDAAQDTRAEIDQLQQRIRDDYPHSQPGTTRVIEIGTVLYEAGDRGVSFFTVLDGEVALQSPRIPGGQRKLTTGEFFGEMSLIAGQPRIERAVAGRNCVLMETPRRTILKLMNSYRSVNDGIVWIYIVRELQRHFLPNATVDQLRQLADEVQRRIYAPGDTLWQAGEPADSVHIIQTGTVALSRQHADKALIVGQIRGGEVLGEMSVLGDSTRDETATATAATETMEISRSLFKKLMHFDVDQVDQVMDAATGGLLSRAAWEVRPESEGLLHFLLEEGLGEATNALFIDESLCVGCDNCERACAETHGGIKRLQRDAGRSFGNVQVPITCRHCQQPHCMKDCPPDAIRRSSSGEIFIDESCIGCGNCALNCPYDAIELAYPPAPKPSLWRWLLFGTGPGPGQRDDDKRASPDAPVRAVKCDACIDQAGGPACVNACPTGAAIRIGPDPVSEIIGRT